MKRLLPIALILIAGYYAIRFFVSVTPRVQTAQALQAAPVVITPSPRPTETPIPSPTIGYQETAIIAQQTAMEAVRVNAAITAEFERRVQEQLQMTAAAEYQYFVVLGWTATAAGTSVPLTSTQQAIYNNQLTTQQAIDSGKLTATAQAPALMVQIADAENYAKTHGTGIVIGWIFQILIGAAVLLGVILAFILLFRPGKIVIEPEETEEEETPAPHFHEDRTGGDFGKYFLPCTEEQLTEIWELVVNGERTFAINRIETTSRTLRRPTLVRLRQWFRANQFATELGAGEISLNDRAVCFIEEWGENHQLQSGYEFAPSPSA